MLKNVKKSKFFEPLAVAHASGQKINEAADAVKCGRSQAYQISSSSEFRQRVSELRSSMAEAAHGVAADALVIAYRTLRELAATAEKDSDRIAAAKAIIGTYLPMTESIEFRQELDDIKRDLVERTGPTAETEPESTKPKRGKKK